MRYYNKYLADRIGLERPYVSVLEKTASVIASKLQSDCQFRLVEFIEDECYVCLSIADKSGRFRIFDVLCYTHSLGELFKKYSGDLIEKIELSYYDNGEKIENDPYYELHYPELRLYNSDLQSAIEPLLLTGINGIETYIAGDYSEHISVLYAIQNLIGKIHIVKVPKNTDLKSKILFSQDLINKRVHISQSGTTVMDVIRSKGIDVFVPLDAKSLTSSFIDEIRWEQLFTSKASRCRVGNVECVNLRIGFEIDSFNNLICRIDDNTGKDRKILIEAPFGGKRELQPTQVLPEEKIVSPIHQITETRPQNTPKHDDEQEKLSCAGEPQSEVIATDYSSELKPKSFKIYNGDIYNYYDLFGDYLIGADEAIVEDSFLRQYYQIDNFRDLIATFIRVSKENQTPTLKKIHLITDLPTEGYTKGSKVVSVEEAVIENKKRLRELAIELNEIGISFTFEINGDKHDRCVIPNNGWYISLGRGLDLFNKAENRYSERTCRETDIAIDRIENRVKVEQEMRNMRRKKRQIKR